MNPSLTPESKTPGQIAYEFFYSDQAPHPWDHTDKFTQSKWGELAQAVIASLPRAGVSVITRDEWKEIMRVEFLTLGHVHELDRLNALLSSTPPTEPTKPEQGWEEFTGKEGHAKGYVVEVGDEWKCSIFEKDWVLISEGCAGQSLHLSARYRRPRQPRQESGDQSTTNQKGGENMRGETPKIDMLNVPCEKSDPLAGLRGPAEQEESGERETPTPETVDHCSVCLHKKPCGCLGIWPYTYSTYPSEHTMVQCHPSNAEEMFYKRTEIDDLVATLERSRDALRLQLANAMVERDKMNAERDAALERVKSFERSLQVDKEHTKVIEQTLKNKREEIRVLNHANQEFESRLTASQTELAEVREKIQLMHDRATNSECPQNCPFCALISSTGHSQESPMCNLCQLESEREGLRNLCDNQSETIAAIAETVGGENASQQEVVRLVVAAVRECSEFKGGYYNVQSSLKATLEREKDLTAKLKAAEENIAVRSDCMSTVAGSIHGTSFSTTAISPVLAVIASWKQQASERDELRATISRLEGELKNALQCEEHFSAKWRENETELTAMKSQPGGRVTEAVLSDALPKNHGLSTSQLSVMLIYLNHHLASPWLPISTPPTEADADRNGKVLFSHGDGTTGGWLWNTDLPDATHWMKIPNLPDLPVEKEDGFEKWLKSNDDAFEWTANPDLNDHMKEGARMTYAALASVKGSGK